MVRARLPAAMQFSGFGRSGVAGVLGVDGNMAGLAGDLRCVAVYIRFLVRRRTVATTRGAVQVHARQVGRANVRTLAREAVVFRCMTILASEIRSGGCHVYIIVGVRCVARGQ